MKKLVEEAGIARATFVHEPSKWDLENAMKIELLEGENVPPPENRLIGPNMLANCAEQLKEFLGRVDIQGSCPHRRPSANG
jgi:hypothetical protein